MCTAARGRSLNPLHRGIIAPHALPIRVASGAVLKGLAQPRDGNDRVEWPEPAAAQAALLDVAEGPKRVVFELEEPAWVVEWHLPGNRDDRLHPRQSGS